MDRLAEDESCWFRPPKSVQEEDSLLVQSNLKSTQYKDKCTVEVFRTWQAACEQNSVYLIREACSKIIIFTVCEDSKRS